MQRPRTRRRTTITLLALLSITVITLDLRGNSAIGSLRKLTVGAFAPAQDVADRVFSPIGDWVDGITSAGSLKNENARLRRELEQARNDFAQSQELANQNAELKRLLDLKIGGEDYAGVAARVLGREPTNFEATIVLDKGSNAGIKAGYPVVDSAGALVGRVVVVNNTRSSVRLVQDVDFGVSVRMTSSNAPGFLQGNGNANRFKVGRIPRDAKVQLNELVATSGEPGSRFPQGISIGTVVGIQEGAVEQSVTVRPIVDFRRLTLVKVLQVKDEL